MQKRIKKVFSNADQVIHLWANQSQSDARCKNCYFENDKVWSYGSHYLLGLLTTYKGVPIAIINNSGYSHTTSKHIHSAFYAVKNHRIAIKTSTGFDSDAVYDGLLKEQQSIIESYFDTFNRTSLCEYSLLTEDDFNNDYSLVYSIKEFNSKVIALKEPQLALDFDFNHHIGLYNDKVKLCIAREELRNTPETLAKLALAKEKKEQAKIKKLEKSIQDWKNGGSLTNDIRNLNSQLIRIVGNEVHTSRGASVPLAHAKRLWSMIQNRTAKTGERVGHFSLDEYNSKEVIIGCHTLRIDEIINVLGKNTLEIVK